MSTVAIIDYGSGNLRSAEKAFARMAREAPRGQTIAVTSDPDAVRAAERIVLPGVGAFADCMAGVRAIPGMIEVLEEKVLKRGTPFLGICVGMQLMATVGREHGDHQGLGWIEGDVVRLTPADPGLKIPHMGWNRLQSRSSHALTGALDGADVYFVHSYHFRPARSQDRLVTTDYAGDIAAVVGRDNLIGTQFHPEKSQAVGLAFLGRFLAWHP